MVFYCLRISVVESLLVNDERKLGENRIIKGSNICIFFSLSIEAVAALTTAGPCACFRSIPCSAGSRNTNLTHYRTFLLCTRQLRLREGSIVQRLYVKHNIVNNAFDFATLVLQQYKWARLFGHQQQQVGVHVSVLLVCKILFLIIGVPVQSPSLFNAADS